ncbi:MAG: electron transfer flavoprotein subunit alpha/FixB family protein [Dehalococcoidales bacterium]|nr:MAG: electron transfer flavoprotein subunit alpha/FixB family protein [Dehalococcoidales bacterium]
MTTHSNIMVFCEQQEGQVHPVSFELLSKSREMADRLGCELVAVLLGDGITAEAIQLIHYGADRVFVSDHPSLRDYDLMNYRHALVELVREQIPEILLFGATNLGRSLAPRVAVALNTGLTADCIGLDIDEDGSLIQIRPAFTGNILAWIKTSTRPQMATVRYKVMQTGTRDITRKGKVIQREFQPVPSFVTIINREKLDGIDISGAEIIISGGRGLKKPDDFGLLNDLAELLGGVVGSSRPLVDEGWIGREHQVGFSGNTVKPKFYIACGISGSAQHMAGMRGSDSIVAINTDPSAPIFRIADYGIIGDLYEVVPMMIKQIRGRK